jgi:hypothetical protein
MVYTYCRYIIRRLDCRFLFPLLRKRYVLLLVSPVGCVSTLFRHALRTKMNVLVLCLLLLFERGTAISKPTASSPFQTCDAIARAPLNRRACSLFVWDAPSALLYKWCHHLLKDNLIEGKGGRMVGLCFWRLRRACVAKEPQDGVPDTLSFFSSLRHSMFASNRTPSFNYYILALDTVRTSVWCAVGAIQTI